jgi:1,4-alpha-glucan branching enzyme
MMGRKRKSKELSSKKNNWKRVNFKISVPEAKKVSLAGDFNNWNVDSHLFKKDSKGNWKITVELELGRYEYRFFIDGEWRNDTNCTSFIPNPYNSENCVLILQ